MINSAIASNHYYYVLFFESSKDLTLNDIPKLFNVTYDYQLISLKDTNEISICHLQLELNRIYGSESILQLNLSNISNDSTYYWYDFYIGEIEIFNKIYFFICYPYIKLGKFIENSLNDKSIKTNYFKPALSAVMKFMSTRNNNGLSQIEKQGFIADIVRYSGEIKELWKRATTVNIIGENPLKSKTFEVLNEHDEISLDTISLKLRCKQLNIGEIDLSFDKLGNYRFWIRRNNQNSSLSVIPYAFKFLMETAVLDDSEHVSDLSLLENE